MMRSFGVAMAAVVLNLALSIRGGQTGIPTSGDFRIAFLATAALALGAVLWYLPLEHDVGNHVSGRRSRSA